MWQLTWADIPDADRSPISATATQNLVAMWILIPGEEVLESADNGFSCLTWHPTGEYLAAGGPQGEVLV